MEWRGSRYDPELQMFTHQPREADLARLRFLRWLCVRDRLEHEAAGASSGEYAGRRLTERAAARR
jgi:hypothetical protein